MYESPQGNRCFIVALEGADRLGKSTQAKMLEASMERHKIRGVVEKAPYKDGVTYDRIYEMLRTGEAKDHPVVFQTFMGVNRHIFQNQYLPTLAGHFDVVVIDRWNVSTLVYGTMDGVPLEKTQTILKGIVEPDLVLIFDGEPFPAPDSDDSYEADKDFQAKVRAAYREWGEARPDQAAFIDANQKPEEIATEVIAHIQGMLLGR